MNKLSFLNKNIFILIVYIFAVLLRFSVILIAHHGDLNNNISWGQIAAQKGLNGFYGSSDSDDWPYSAPNQPPLTILTFAATANVWGVINDKVTDFNWRYKIFPSKFVWFWEESGWDFLIKTPSLFADLCIGYFIYFFLKRKKRKNAILFASIWLFNPISWYNSSIWGQTDSIVNLFGLLAISNLLNKNLLKFSFWFSLSFLFKASLGVFVPLLIYVVLNQQYKIKVWVKSTFVILLTTFSVGIWFHPKLDYFIWLYNLYRERILPGEIGYLTANAFNFWWLVNPGDVRDSMVFFGLTARLIGIILSLFFVFILIYKIHKRLSVDNILFGLATSALIIFIFMTRIHPRYLYPFFPLMTICLSYINKLKFPFIVLTLAHLANIYYLFWIPDIPLVKSLYSDMLFTNSISILFILNLLYLFLITPTGNYKKIPRRYN